MIEDVFWLLLAESAPLSVALNPQRPHAPIVYEATALLCRPRFIFHAGQCLGFDNSGNLRFEWFSLLTLHELLLGPTRGYRGEKSRGGRRENCYIHREGPHQRCETGSSRSSSLTTAATRASGSTTSSTDEASTPGPTEAGQWWCWREAGVVCGHASV